MKNKLYYWKSNKITNKKYFKDQLVKPKYSTVEFFNFLNKNKCIKNNSIIDVACGNGANLIFLKKKYKSNHQLLGLDFNNLLIKQAKYLSKGYKNLKFEKGNLYHLNKKYKKKYDGIICIQTLLNVEDYEKPIKEFIKLNPKFIAVSSLFWEGDIDFKIKVNFLKKNSKRKIKSFVYYNIYSLKNYINFLKKKYKKNTIFKFKLKKKLFLKDKQKMGTYTLKHKNELIPISGPLIVNTYFILSQKN
jgi:ubiquinone/menaquinone biosynthesis C-methylase UbiE